jgi:hypothetical protein
MRILLLLALCCGSVAAQGGTMPGPGTPHTTAACSVGADIGNGWCEIAKTAAGSPNGSTVTTSGIDTTGADLLIVVISYYDGNGAITSGKLSDSKSNTWVSAISQADQSTTAANFVLYSKPTSVGSAHTFTVAASAGLTYQTISVYTVSGSHASPLDQTASSQGSLDTSRQPGSITPSANNCLIISGWTLITINGGSPSIGSGFTVETFVDNDGANHQAGSLASFTQATAAAINPTWTWTVPGANAATIVSFKHS